MFIKENEENMKKQKKIMQFCVPVGIINKTV